jgi:D-alanyl-D-alanine carboxypeptidase (penicillin-binding protein 5/6)
LGAQVFGNGFPKRISDAEAPEISAQAALVKDVKNRKVLFELNPNKRLAPASTTKLMTAIVAMNLYSMDDVVPVPETCMKIDSTKAWLPVGAEFKVKDLVYSLLIASAGDSACVLAVGNVSYNEFVYLMNQRANQFGMQNSYFTNPIGLDDIASSHYSTASDLMILAENAILDSEIRNIVKTKSYIVKSVDEEHLLTINNTNRLLWEVPQTVGIKTGTTEEAGEVLIYEYADDIKDLVIVVMGSEDRFSDTRSLLSWVLSSYSWAEE